MDFAGILAFSSKKHRLMSSNKERRPSGYSLDGFLSRDDADPAWISCFFFEYMVDEKESWKNWIKSIHK